MSQLIPLAESVAPCQASVVFIHGLGGHPYETWQAKGNEDTSEPPFWPIWLAQDLPRVDVYTVGYSASASGWTGQTMAVEDRAENICELLLKEHGLSNAPIFFVCHSLGGIILKRVLLRLKERSPHEADAKSLFAAIRKTVFLATPHTGSDKAGLMDRFRLMIWPTLLTKALISNAATLRQVNTSYRLLAREREEDLSHKVLFETRSTALGRIVREGSADPGLVNVDALGIDADHITIVKPGSRNTLTHKSVLGFLSEDLTHDGESLPKILKRPAFEVSKQVDIPGVVSRLAALACLVALGWYSVLQPNNAANKGEPDVVQIIYAVAAIEDNPSRLAVAERLLDRPLSPKQRQLIENLQLSEDNTRKIDTANLNELADTGTTEDLRAAVAQIEISPCENNKGFEIVDERLRCASGEFVPFVSTPNTSGPISSLEALVFHFTATKDASQTIRLYASSETRASTHVLIDRSGRVVQMVPFDSKAWHVGRSSYEPLGLTGMNNYSVAISMVNLGQLTLQSDGTYRGWAGGGSVQASEVIELKEDGQTTYWHKYSPEQIAAATAVAQAFRSSQPEIILLGHSNVAPGRKLDPGPVFPLEQIDQDTR